jgi:hypothetical protein
MMPSIECRDTHRRVQSPAFNQESHTPKYEYFMSLHTVVIGAGIAIGVAQPMEKSVQSVRA